jgi:2-oxoglutarate dehydrogenase E1 component
VQHHIQDALKEGQRLSYAGRPASASPAAGYYDKHYAQQKELLTAALGDAPKTKTRKAS